MARSDERPPSVLRNSYLPLVAAAHWESAALAPSYHSSPSALQSVRSTPRLRRSATIAADDNSLRLGQHGRSVVNQ